MSSCRILPETSSDEEKILYIFVKYSPFMSFTAKQVLGSNETQIQDAVQSAMVKIIENIHIIDFSDERRVRNLCGVIAKNAAIDICKLRDNQRVSLEDEIIQTMEEDDSDPMDIIIKKDTYDKILEAIYSLDDIFRDICILKYVNGLKEREIAVLLDLPEKTVNGRIFRARQILKEVLRKEGIHV